MKIQPEQAETSRQATTCFYFSSIIFYPWIPAFHWQPKKRCNKLFHSILFRCFLDAPFGNQGQLINLGKIWKIGRTFARIRKAQGKRRLPFFCTSNGYCKYYFLECRNTRRTIIFRANSHRDIFIKIAGQNSGIRPFGLPLLLHLTARNNQKQFVGGSMQKGTLSQCFHTTS